MRQFTSTRKCCNFASGRDLCNVGLIYFKTVMRLRSGLDIQLESFLRETKILISKICSIRKHSQEARSMRYGES